MPTYSYSCTECKQGFDAFQKISDDALITCPSCGKDALQKGLGGGNVSFQFKGGGFYKTDYPKSGSSPSCCPCGKDQGSCKK